MAAALAAAQSRPADEREAALEEEQNHPVAVVLEVDPEEEQSRLLAVCQEAVQEGARSPRAVCSAGNAAGDAAGDTAGDAAGCDIPAAVQNTGLPSHLSSRRRNSAPALEEGRCFSHPDCQNTCWRSVCMRSVCISNQAIEFTVPCCSRLTNYIRGTDEMVLRGS